MYVGRSSGGSQDSPGLLRTAVFSQQMVALAPGSSELSAIQSGHLLTGRYAHLVQVLSQESSQKVHGLAVSRDSSEGVRHGNIQQLGVLAWSAVDNVHQFTRVGHLGQDGHFVSGVLNINAINLRVPVEDGMGELFGLSQENLDSSRNLPMNKTNE